MACVVCAMLLVAELRATFACVDAFERVLVSLWRVEFSLVVTLFVVAVTVFVVPVAI